MRGQPTDAPSLPTARAAARVAANDAGPSVALAVAARWCSATHATEHRARPSIVPIFDALDAAQANPTRETFGALSTALVRWCVDASARGNAVDLAPAMLGAVNAAAALDAAAELAPVDGAATVAEWLRSGLSVPEPWRSLAMKGAADFASLVSLDVPRIPRRP